MYVRGATPLIFTAAQGHHQVVTLLTEAGADADARNAEGTTALMIASYVGNGNIVRGLVKAGANTRLKDTEGRTAMVHAAVNDHIHVLEILDPKGSWIYATGYVSRDERINYLLNEYSE